MIDLILCYFQSIFIYFHIYIYNICSWYSKERGNSFPFETNYSPMFFFHEWIWSSGAHLAKLAALDPVLPFSFIVHEAFCIVGCGETVMPAVWPPTETPPKLHGNDATNVGTQGTWPMAWRSANGKAVFRCVQLKVPGGSVAVQERGQEPWLLGWQ